LQGRQLLTNIDHCYLPKPHRDRVEIIKVDLTTDRTTLLVPPEPLIKTSPMLDTHTAAGLKILAWENYYSLNITVGVELKETYKGKKKQNQIKKKIVICH
jgi:hypothetical protein